MARIRRNHAAQTVSTQPQIWKLGKYIRLSRDDGNIESESITNQRKILDEQIPNYFDDDYDIVDEYIDDGRTGTSNETRPEFLRLVEDVKSRPTRTREYLIKRKLMKEQRGIDITEV